jgi:energy-coupling factor transporter transmembrane protein EcfT
MGCFGRGRCSVQTFATIDSERIHAMGLILLVLLLVLIFASAGFALHVLWIVAVVLLLVWLLGFLVSGAEHSWYRVQKK